MLPTLENADIKFLQMDCKRIGVIVPSVHRNKFIITVSNKHDFRFYVQFINWKLFITWNFKVSAKSDSAHF